MSDRHAGPPGTPETAPVPEPSYAERARTLLHQGRTGMLATLSRRRPGHPFGSVMPYAVDDPGRPLVLHVVANPAPVTASRKSRNPDGSAIGKLP